MKRFPSKSKREDVKMNNYVEEDQKQLKQITEERQKGEKTNRSNRPKTVSKEKSK